MRGRLGIVGALVAIAAACTFNSPLDDREPALGPLPKIDGSVQPSDATFTDDEEDAALPVADAMTDTSSIDATVEAATVDADAGAPRPCDATFCDDFDFGPLGARWAQINAAATAGTLDLVDAGRSAPFALRATAFGGALTFRDVDLAKQFGSVKTASCTFAVKPVERPGRPAVFFYRGLTTSSDNWYASITLADTETTLGLAIFFKDGGVPSEAIATAPPAPIGEWTELRIATTQTKLTLSVNGVPAADLPMKLATSTSGFSAHLGIQAIETTQEVVLFDDVRCDVF